MLDRTLHLPVQASKRPAQRKKTGVEISVTSITPKGSNDGTRYDKKKESSSSSSEGEEQGGKKKGKEEEKSEEEEDDSEDETFPTPPSCDDEDSSDDDETTPTAPDMIISRRNVPKFSPSLNAHFHYCDLVRTLFSEYIICILFITHMI